ncbi:MAG TPA: hypothetical protein VFJ71_09330 [Candidatus Limnocylindrales bacterium]|nr:hypothetical protein [Candidatus Limnocylindrales bacterium]
MGLRYRSIRAGATALVVAAAVGSGGMTGMASALAADPGTVSVAGHLVDGAGSALAGVHLTIVEELPPDGGIAAFPLTTGSDGSFGADLYAWGTAAAPASVTIATDPDQEIDVIGGSCTQTWGVTVSDARELALAEAAPDPLTVTATTTLLGEVCGTTGTPGGGSTGGNSGAGGGSERTPPPTDSGAAPAAGSDRLGAALTLGFLAGVVLVSAFLLPRRRAGRSR